MIAPKSPSASGEAACYYSGSLESACATGTAMASRENSQGRHQDPLCLLLAHRSPTPALPDRPLADAPLQAHNVPDAGAHRPLDAAQRAHRIARPAACSRSLDRPCLASRDEVLPQTPLQIRGEAS